MQSCVESPKLGSRARSASQIDMATGSGNSLVKRSRTQRLFKGKYPRQRFVAHFHGQDKDAHAEKLRLDTLAVKLGFESWVDPAEELPHRVADLDDRLLRLRCRRRARDSRGVRFRVMGVEGLSSVAHERREESVGIVLDVSTRQRLVEDSINGRERRSICGRRERVQLNCEQHGSSELVHALSDEWVRVEDESGLGGTRRR